MRHDDPYALCLAYTRKMMAFLLFNDAPRHILQIEVRLAYTAAAQLQQPRGTRQTDHSCISIMPALPKGAPK
jgi:hypothetical protein